MNRRERLAKRSMHRHGALSETCVGAWNESEARPRWRPNQQMKKPNLHARSSNRNDHIIQRELSTAIAFPENNSLTDDLR